MAAPDGVFQRDFALMLNVWRSWSLNQQMLRDRMQDAANKMRQTGEILRSAARGQSEAYDRANKGFSYYIRGVEVLEHIPSGKRGNFDRDYADLVVKADPPSTAWCRRVSTARPTRRRAGPRAVVLFTSSVRETSMLRSGHNNVVSTRVECRAVA